MNNRLLYKNYNLFLSFVFLALCISCTQLTNTTLFTRDSISIMTYNTQTFFDIDDTGKEFSEFTGSSSAWTKEKYDTRLNRLREVLYIAGEKSGAGASCSPDIVVLQEVESQMVIKDLCNRLSQNSQYRFAVVPPLTDGSSFTSVVLSRYPIISVSTHTVFYPETSIRPIVEVLIETPLGLCGLFAVHWKSKADSIDTAQIRKAQELLLLTRIQIFETSYPSAFWIVSGDCNQTLEEFSYLQAYTSPWVSYIPKQVSSFERIEGSYTYNKQWEKIDHFWFNEHLLAATGNHFFKFLVVANDALLSTSGEPYRYNVFSGNGYSDHLPLVLIIKRNK